jgi:hypothetical protein
VISPKLRKPSTAIGDHEFMSRFAAVFAFEQHYWLMNTCSVQSISYLADEMR